MQVVFFWFLFELVESMTSSKRFTRCERIKWLMKINTQTWLDHSFLGFKWVNECDWMNECGLIISLNFISQQRWNEMWKPANLAMKAGLKFFSFFVQIARTAARCANVVVVESHVLEWNAKRKAGSLRVKIRTGSSWKLFPIYSNQTSIVHVYMWMIHFWMSMGMRAMSTFVDGKDTRMCI